MIISKSRNFIFVHVPKAAGTSVSRHLSQFTEAGDVDINPPLSAFAEYHCREFGLRKHTTAQEIRAFVGPDAFSSAFKFAFVRNPYARLFSLYNFLKFKWRRWEGSQIMDRFPRFADFVRSDFFSCGTAEGAGRDSIYRLFGSQMFWLCEDGKRPLLDFVGRVERLEADFDHICAGVGLPAPGPSLDRLNVSDGSSPTSTRLNRIRVALGLRSTARGAAKTLESLQQAYAEEDIRRAVAERYACDFDAFGYALDVPAASRV